MRIQTPIPDNLPNNLRWKNTFFPWKFPPQKRGHFRTIFPGYSPPTFPIKNYPRKISPNKPSDISPNNSPEMPAEHHRQLGACYIHVLQVGLLHYLQISGTPAFYHMLGMATPGAQQNSEGHSSLCHPVVKCYSCRRPSVQVCEYNNGPSQSMLLTIRCATCDDVSNV